MNCRIHDSMKVVAKTRAIFFAPMLHNMEGDAPCLGDPLNENRLEDAPFESRLPTRGDDEWRAYKVVVHRLLLALDDVYRFHHTPLSHHTVMV